MIIICYISRLLKMTDFISNLYNIAVISLQYLTDNKRYLSFIGELDNYENDENYENYCRKNNKKNNYKKIKLDTKNIFFENKIEYGQFIDIESY